MSRGVQTGTVEELLDVSLPVPVEDVVVETGALEEEEVVLCEAVLAPPTGAGSEPQLAAMPKTKMVIPRAPSFTRGWAWMFEKVALRMGNPFEASPS
jgi:hypothetical protein